MTRHETRINEDKAIIETVMIFEDGTEEVASWITLEAYYYIYHRFPKLPTKKNIEEEL